MTDLPDPSETRRKERRRLEERLLVILLLGGIFLLASRRAPEMRREPIPPGEHLLHRIDLNRAEWYELTFLPGIGEVRAKEIVADRERHGPFEKPADLLRVRGIGPVTVEKIQKNATEGP